VAEQRTQTPQATHELKCWPAFFQAIRDGGKTFEVRRNDRGFQRGDVLRLREWHPQRVANNYTGNDLWVEVTYVLSGHEGIRDGFVVMGIQEYDGD
jgi:Domain of unknown function (DUF3850)